MGENSLKTITFDGTKDGYQSLEFNMRAFLKELGYSEAVSRTDIEAAVLDDDSTKKNDIAYARIAMAMMMEDPHHSELVRRSVSLVYPEGDAALAWEALSNRYEPRNGKGQQTLMTELFASTSENGLKDPGIWVFELQRKQYELNAMGAILSDTVLMGRILSKFPQEYECVADNLARRENKSIASVSLVLMDKYERLKKTGMFRSTEETVLVGYKKFSGDCRYCGKKGHKAAE
jgi:choline dehydrogenase-like flavoprotein